MRSVDRTLAVFESFTKEKNSLTLQEIADKIGLAKSTAFRLVQSLEQAGYLTRVERQQYCLSFRFTRLAGFVRSTLGIRDIARPVMAELADRTEETVSIHTIDGENRVCIDSVASAATPLRSVIQAGEQVPLQSGSASKVLMAYMAARELAPILTLIIRRTKRPRAEILAELEQVRAQGYAISHGERLLGVSAISAPITDMDDSTRYCLSVGGASVRIQPRAEELIPMATEAAASISLGFGAKRVD